MTTSELSNRITVILGISWPIGLYTYSRGDEFYLIVALLASIAVYHAQLQRTETEIPDGIVTIAHLMANVAMFCSTLMITANIADYLALHFLLGFPIIIVIAFFSAKKGHDMVEAHAQRLLAEKAPPEGEAGEE